MALPIDVYKELEDIIGPENISQDPAILNACTRAAFSDVYSGKIFMDPPEAMLLPGSTEDVQAIVRLCNRRGIKAKAYSTGYGPWAFAGGEGVIGRVLAPPNYGSPGTKHTYPQPENHTAAQYTEHELNHAVLEELGKAEVD